CNSISSSKNSAATIDVAPAYVSPSSGRKSINASRCTLGDSDSTDTINESRSSIAASLTTFRNDEYESIRQAGIIIVHHTRLSSITSTLRRRARELSNAIHKRRHSRTPLIVTEPGDLLTSQ